MRRILNTSTGINVGVGSAAMVAAALIAAAVPASEPVVRLGLPAVALAGFAAITVDLRAAAFVTMVGYLIHDGFLVDRLGQLSWHGPADLYRFLALCAAALVGLAAGTAYRWVADRRRFAPVEAWANGERPGSPST
jgi:hypothetical protein